MQNETKKKNYTDLIAGVIIMAIAVFFYWTTLGTKSFLGTGRGRVAPDTIPKIIAVAMLIIGAIITVQWFIRTKKGMISPKVVEDDSADCEGMTEQQIEKRHLFQRITMPITLVLVAAYIFIMSEVGFTISTFIFLTLQITLLSTDFSAKSWLKSLLIARQHLPDLWLRVQSGCAEDIGNRPGPWQSVSRDFRLNTDFFRHYDKKEIDLCWNYLRRVLLKWQTGSALA